MRKNFLKLLFFVATLYMMGQEAAAQIVQRWKIPGLVNTETIVRRWNLQYAVGYAKDPRGTNLFFLWDYNNIMPSSSLKTIPLPSGLVVHDFRILNDMVYFCGEDASQGIVGFFDLSTISFPGGTTINYVELTPISGPYVTCAKRMDVFTYGGIKHIAFVGDLLSTSSGVPITTTTVGDVYWDGTDWYVDYYVTNGDMIYTDIAASSGYVVAAAKEKNTSDCYVQVFNLSNDILTTPLIVTPFNTSFMYKLTGSTPVGEVRVEDISPTEFAVAFHYDDQGVVGTEVKQVIIDPSVPAVDAPLTLKTPLGASAYYTSACSVKQLCYNLITRRLFLLQDAVCNQYLPPSLESSILWYDLANIGSGIADMSYMPGIAVDRMDVAATGFFYTIGGSGGQVMLSLDYSYPAALCRTDLPVQYEVSDGLVVDMPHTDSNIGLYRAANHPLWIPTSSDVCYFDCNE